MRAAWDSDTRQLALVCESEDELTSLHAGIREQNGFMVPLEVELPLYSQVSVTLTLDGRSRLELEAEVVQVFAVPSGGWNTAFLATEIPDSLDHESADRDETEMRGTAPVFRIRKMHPPEKARLAVRAGRDERQVLLRDSSPTVLQALLANPRLEAKEVLRMVKSTHASAGILKRIAGDPRWGKNQEILSSVAKNPKTPPPLAVRLIDRLRTSDLHRMGKMSSGLREDVRQAALREYLRRSGRRGR